LCSNFLGCFTCPNAVITADAPSLARLLQARDHLRAASTYLHPARWQVVYSPQLQILEEDILTRFSARELATAEPLRGALPPLPELR
jgi:predicted P-loop ATPase/GTPase